MLLVFGKEKGHCFVIAFVSLSKRCQCGASGFSLFLSFSPSFLIDSIKFYRSISFLLILF